MIDYRPIANPAVLHRKETLLSPDRRELKLHWRTIRKWASGVFSKGLAPKRPSKLDPSKGDRSALGTSRLFRQQIFQQLKKAATRSLFHPQAVRAPGATTSKPAFLTLHFQPENRQVDWVAPAQSGGSTDAASPSSSCAGLQPQNVSGVTLRRLWSTFCALTSTPSNTLTECRSRSGWTTAKLPFGPDRRLDCFNRITWILPASWVQNPRLRVGQPQKRPRGNAVAT